VSFLGTGWSWVVWLGLFIALFAVNEGYAIAKGKLTLSAGTWNVFKAWPPIAVLFGMVFGGLAVHFFWHWCPT
jgi:hypothetical protein